MNNAPAGQIPNLPAFLFGTKTEIYLFGVHKIVFVKIAYILESLRLKRKNAPVTQSLSDASLKNPSPL